MGSGDGVLYVGMVIFQVLVALIPGEPLEIAGGYAFGAWGGEPFCACLAPPWAAPWCSWWSAGGASGFWAVLPQEKLNLSNLCKHPKSAGCGLPPHVHPRHTLKTSSATAWG